MSRIHDSNGATNVSIVKDASRRVQSIDFRPRKVGSLLKAGSNFVLEDENLSEEREPTCY